MNSIQRRLFRAFADVGGDLSEDADVERFIRYVEGNLILLPPKVREATELIWRSKDASDYSSVAALLSRRERMPVNQASLRQRVSRGVRLLEEAVRRGPWGNAGGNGRDAKRSLSDPDRPAAPQVPRLGVRR